MGSNDPSEKTGNGTGGPRGRPSIRRPVPRNQIAVSRGAGMVILRIVGAGNMLNAPALNDFAEQQIVAGFRRFVFDLQACQALDSTFMGCMVGLANGLKKELAKAPSSTTNPPPVNPGPEEEPVEELSPEEALAALKAQLTSTAGSGSRPSDKPFVVAVNASSEVRELLGILGVDKFVPLLGHLVFPDLETTTLPDLEMTPEQRREMILKAHENLVEIDKRNESQFGAFLKSLSDELSKPRPSA